MKISISVPKPCHENWNAMTPATDPTTGIGGRHCDSCQHTVMDLTRASDAQLIDLFRTDAMPKCARFSQGQLDRVIALEERTPRLLATAAVGAALALASPDADAQTCTPMLGKMMIARPIEVVEVKTVGEMVAMPIDTVDHIIEPIQMGQPIMPVQGDVEAHPITGDTVVVRTPEHPVKGEMQIRGGRTAVTYYYIDGVKGPTGSDLDIPRSAIEEVQVITGGLPVNYGDAVQQPLLTITGRVLDETGAPFPFTSVHLRGSERDTIADEEGRYTLSVPINSVTTGATLIVSAVGYSEQEIAVPPFAAQPNENACVYDNNAPLTGRIVHADGVGAAGVTVELKEAGAFCITDAKGYFSFDGTVIADLRKITIAVETEGEERTRTIGSDVLPCSVAFSLNSAAPVAVVATDSVDLGDATLWVTQSFVLGMWAETIPVKQSFGHRAAQPFRWIGKQVSRPFR